MSLGSPKWTPDKPDNCRTIVRHLSGFCPAVVRHLSGSCPACQNLQKPWFFMVFSRFWPCRTGAGQLCRTKAGQLSGSCPAFVRQLSGRCPASQNLEKPLVFQCFSRFWPCRTTAGQVPDNFAGQTPDNCPAVVWQSCPARIENPIKSLKILENV